MPQITLTTNQEDPQDPVAFRGLLSKKLAEWLGKPEDYSMVHTQFSSGLSFAGTEEPAASVTISSLGLEAEGLADLTKTVCSFIQEELRIDPARIYIRFTSPPRTHWGWNGKTFA